MSVKFDSIVEIAIGVFWGTAAITLVLKLLNYGVSIYKKPGNDHPPTGTIV